MTGRISAEVASNRELISGVYSLVLCVGRDICAQTRTGQFINVYPDDKSLLLPRPLGVCDIAGDCLRVVYRVIGKGTDKLSELRAGETVDVLAPLGNGFPIEEGKSAAIIGGGLGIPPLCCLKSANADVFLGFGDEIFLTEAFANPRIATDSGRTGFKGNAVGLLKISGKKYDVIYACGPYPMLRAVAEYAREIGAKCYVSMEERMGCGYGACVGCAVKTVNGYKKVCTDGPVFDAEEIVWD